MTRREIKDFCNNFAYRFISSECMEKTFRSLTCKDAQEVKEHLENSMDLNLQDWLEEKNVELDGE